MSYFTKLWTTMFQSNIATDSAPPSVTIATSPPIPTSTPSVPTTPPRNNHNVSHDAINMERELSSSSIHDALTVSKSPTGSQSNPIKLVDYSFSDTESESDIDTSSQRIPLPPTENSDGIPLLWRSEDRAFDALQAFAKDNGFAVKKADKRVNKSGLYTRYINCVRGGPKHTTKVATPQRKRQSKSIIALKPCKFRAAIKEQDQTNRWILVILFGTHSHPRTNDTNSIAVHRRNTRKADPRITQHIDADWRSQIEPKKTWSTIRAMYPNSTMTIQDVRNQRYRHSVILDEGLPAIQALFRSLGDKFTYQEVIDEERRLVHLVIFHWDAIDVLKKWPYAICIDSTYKTNKHGLYLCQIIGTTALNTAFIIGQAFLSSEDADAYGFVVEWLRQVYIRKGLGQPTSITTDKCGALISALKSIFPTVPRLLCVWHVNKNVEAHCKAEFRRLIRENEPGVGNGRLAPFIDAQWNDFKKDWHRVLYAKTIDDCDDSWDALYAKWTESNGTIIKYLQDTWMSEKELVVEAYTHRIMHFGNATTSKAEAMHKAFKSDLPKSHQVHLREAIRYAQAFISRAISNLSHQISTDRVRIDSQLRKDFIFNNLHGSISSFAMRKVREHALQLQKVRRDSIPSCKGTFTATWGMPCGHRYLECHNYNSTLAVEEFHAQWRVDKEDECDDVVDLFFTYRDPIKVRSKQAGKATTRELSLFEHVRLQNPPPTTTQCENFTAAPLGVTVHPRDPHPVVTSSNLPSLLRNGGRSVDTGSVSETFLGAQAQSTQVSITNTLSQVVQNNINIDHIPSSQPPTTEHSQHNQTPQEESCDVVLSGSHVSLNQMEGWLNAGTQWIDDAWSMFPPAPASQLSQPAPPQPPTLITPQRTTFRDSDQAPEASPTPVQLIQPLPTFIRPDVMENEEDVVMQEEPVVDPAQASPRRSKRSQRPPQRPESELWY